MNTGRRVASLTNRATCGFQNSAVTYQTPSAFVVGPPPGEGPPQRSRTFLVAWTTNTGFSLPLTDQAGSILRRPRHLSSSVPVLQRPHGCEPGSSGTQSLGGATRTTRESREPIAVHVHAQGSSSTPPSTGRKSCWPLRLSTIVPADDFDELATRAGSAGQRSDAGESCATRPLDIHASPLGDLAG